MIALALKLPLANAHVPFQCTRTRARPFCIIHIYAHFKWHMHTTSTSAGRGPGSAAGRVPGPGLTPATRMRPTEPGCAGRRYCRHRYRSAVLWSCVFTCALEFGLVWGVVGLVWALRNCFSSHAARQPQPSHLLGFKAAVLTSIFPPMAPSHIHTCSSTHHT